MHNNEVVISQSVKN